MHSIKISIFNTFKTIDRQYRMEGLPLAVELDGWEKSHTSATGQGFKERRVTVRSVESQPRTHVHLA